MDLLLILGVVSSLAIIFFIAICVWDDETQILGLVIDKYYEPITDEYFLGIITTEQKEKITYSCSLNEFEKYEINEFLFITLNKDLTIKEIYSAEI